MIVGNNMESTIFPTMIVGNNMESILFPTMIVGNINESQRTTEELPS